MSTWRCLSLALMLAMSCAVIPAHADDVPTLKCEVGPVIKQYGGTDWRVYSCDDNSSLVIVTAPGNPAAPFYFFYKHSGNGYELHGEGTGDKSLTDAASHDLQSLTDDQIVSLLLETQKASIHP